MDPEVPLVVSEVNPHAIDEAVKGIIANPNCTTMAAMPVLKVLHDEAGLERLIVSHLPGRLGRGSRRRRGAARAGACRRRAGRHRARARRPRGRRSPSRTKFPRTIAFDVIPLAGSIVDDGDLETDEEKKLRNESRKILELPDLRVAGTCVRVPVFTGHSLVDPRRVRQPDHARARDRAAGGCPGRRALRRAHAAAGRRHRPELRRSHPPGPVGARRHGPRALHLATTTCARARR